MKALKKYPIIVLSFTSLLSACSSSSNNTETLDSSSDFSIEEPLELSSQALMVRASGKCAIENGKFTFQIGENVFQETADCKNGQWALPGISLVGQAEGDFTITIKLRSTENVVLKSKEIKLKKQLSFKRIRPRDLDSAPVLGGDIYLSKFLVPYAEMYLGAGINRDLISVDNLKSYISIPDEINNDNLFAPSINLIRGLNYATNELYTSRDGGKTWAKHNLLTAANNATYIINRSLTFSKSGLVFYTTGNAFWISKDDGQTARELTVSDLHLPISFRFAVEDLLETKSGKILLMGDMTLVSTSDQGETFKYIQLPEDFEGWKMRQDSSGNVIMVGDEKYYISSDEGETFTTHDLSVLANTGAMDYIIDAAGNIYVYFDGGPNANQIWVTKGFGNQVEKITLTATSVNNMLITPEGKLVVSVSYNGDPDNLPPGEGFLLVSE